MNYYKNIYHLAKINTEDKFIELMSERSLLDEDIATEVIHLSGISKDLILSKKRDRLILTARQVIHYSVIKLTGMSEQFVADKYWNGRHSAIVNSLYAVQNMIDTKDPLLHPYINFLTIHKLM